MNNPELIHSSKGEIIMKQTKRKTILKPLRIPEPVVNDIEREAYKKNTTFSDVANYRLQHYNAPLTPALLAKMQDIANLATEAANQSSPTKANIVQMEVALLWKSLK